MKIRDLRTVAFSTPLADRVFLQITTDGGVTGWGEATLEANGKITETAVLELRPYIIGLDPTRVEMIWQSIYRTFWGRRSGAIFMSALSGIEQALWDITGKAYGVPVYRLLGGPTRERVRAYTHAMGGSPEELAQSALELSKAGFTAVKFLSHPDGKHDWDENIDELKQVVARVKAVREAVGEKIEIMVDCHGRYSPSFAIKVGKSLEEFNLLFLEEPVSPENVSSIKRVASNVNIPIAAGERRYTRYDFTEICHRAAIDVIQPDPSHAGGISEVRKIASMAEAHDILLAPHNVGIITTVAALHIDATVSNFLIQEYRRWGLPHNCLRPQLEIENGFFKLPTGPGLGFEIDEDVLKDYPYEQYVIRPKLDSDGAVMNF
jgi:galactonate dehydratase